MITWWNGLELIQQIFALVAMPATLILVIQTILLLIGIGGGHDASLHGGDVHTGDMHTGDMHTGDMHTGDMYDGTAAHDLHADGSTGDTGHDLHNEPAASHDAGLRLFTLQGIVAFFAIGGWVGIASIDLGLHSALASFLALIAGTLSLLLVAWLLRLMLIMQSSGNIDIRNAIGLTGEVYLRIPGNQQGYGKISLLLQERAMEIDAMTDQPEDIETGRQIEVVGQRGDRLLVRRLP